MGKTRAHSQDVKLSTHHVQSDRNLSLTEPSTHDDTLIPSGTPDYWETAKRTLVVADPRLGEVIERFSVDHDQDPPLRSRGDLFYTLAQSIVGQQISAAAAAAVWSRLVESLGNVEARLVTDKSIEDLRSVGLSKRKAEYLLGVAQAMPQLLTFPWTQMTDDEVRTTLITLRGVGAWTAEMVLIFTLNRPDILPLGDVGVIRAVERLYHQGKKLSKSEVEVIAERWRPYRTVAVWYLWRTIDSDPVEY